MMYPILANSVLIVHLVFILFVIFGGFFVIYRKWIACLHIPAVFWAVLIEFNGWICPLTPLENHFRILAGQIGYSQGFIQHYLLEIIYPQGLTREIQLILGAGVLIINLFFYAFLCLKIFKKK